MLFFCYSMDLSERPKEIKVSRMEQKFRMPSPEASHTKEPPKRSSERTSVGPDAPVRVETPSYRLSPVKLPGVNRGGGGASQQLQTNSIRNYFQPHPRKRSVPLTLSEKLLWVRGGVQAVQAWSGLPPHCALDNSPCLFLLLLAISAFGCAHPPACGPC